MQMFFSNDFPMICCRLLAAKKQEVSPYVALACFKYLIHRYKRDGYWLGNTKRQIYNAFVGRCLGTSLYPRKIIEISLKRVFLHFSGHRYGHFMEIICLKAP